MPCDIPEIFTIAGLRVCGVVDLSIQGLQHSFDFCGACVSGMNAESEAGQVL